MSECFHGLKQLFSYLKDLPEHKYAERFQQMNAQFEREYLDVDTEKLQNFLRRKN